MADKFQRQPGLGLPAFARTHGFSYAIVYKVALERPDLAFRRPGCSLYKIPDPERLAAAIRERLDSNPPLIERWAGRRRPPRPGTTPDAGGTDGAS